MDRTTVTQKKDAPVCVSPKDKTRLALAQSETMRCISAAQAAQWKRKYHEVVAELDALKITRMHENITADSRISERQHDEAAKEAQEQYESLATEMGKRYSFDWRKTGVDPETGSLIAIP